MNEDLTKMQAHSEFKSFIKFPEGAESQRCFYTLRVDPYGRGCMHNCQYCYAYSLLDFRHLWDKENPAVADMKKIRKIFEDAFEKDKNTKYASLLKERRPIRLGGMTDTLQPMEEKLEVTYELLKMLKEYEYPYLLLTKSSLVGTDKYIDVIDKDLAYVQLTITSLNERLSKLVEPGAPIPTDRLSALKNLSDAGIYCAGRLSPLFPTNEDGYFSNGINSAGKSFDYFSFDLVDKICQTGCNTLISEFMRFTPFGIKKMSECLGEDISWLLNENSIKNGGARHFSTGEKKYYFEKVKSICDQYGTEFTVCDDGDYEAFKYLWSNPNDCCNGLDKIKGFSKTWKND